MATNASTLHYIHPELHGTSYTLRTPSELQDSKYYWLGQAMRSRDMAREVSDPKEQHILLKGAQVMERKAAELSATIDQRRAPQLQLVMQELSARREAIRQEREQQQTEMLAEQNATEVTANAV